MNVHSCVDSTHIMPIGAYLPLDLHVIVGSLNIYIYHWQALIENDIVFMSFAYTKIMKKFAQMGIVWFAFEVQCTSVV